MASANHYDIIIIGAGGGDPVPDEIPEPLAKAILDARHKSDA